MTSFTCAQNPSDGKTSTSGLWVGLTGGIGSGKSTVTKLLREYGAIIADADTIAREVVSRPMVLAELVETFGTDILVTTKTGECALNRAKLANIVFNDPSKLAQLNAITHPKIAQSAIEILKTAPVGKVGIYDAAILLDHGRPAYLDLIVVVTAPIEIRLQRLVETRGMDPADAKARVTNQMTDQQRAHYADYIIDNSADLTALATNVQLLWRAIQQHPKLQGQNQMESSDG